MIETHFCSRVAQSASAASGASLLPGTGVRGAVYVFLPVQKQRWGDDELNDGWAAPPLLAAIRAARKAGVVTRLYNPPAGSGEDAPILVRASPQPGPASTGAVQTLLSRAPPHWSVDDAEGPLLAVCTHGTRDRCCAKWGFAVYREAMRLHGAGLSPFRPVECSHLGGDRFAATGIFFPSGSMYAHLDRADLQALAAAEAAGDLAPVHYRGRVFENELTQIVRAGLARDGYGVRAASPLEVPDGQAAPGEVEVAADDGARRFLVRIGVVQTAFYGSCAALAHSRLSRVRRLIYEGARPL